MDKEEILSGLNDKQKEAVMQTEGPCLVIAGAGSGKTKVLTHKIAYEIANGVKPWNILAITFTNKAANEMKSRVENLVGDVAKDMWIGTFHSICVRILRKQIDRIGFDTSFIIFDTSDEEIYSLVDVELYERLILNIFSNAINAIDTLGVELIDEEKFMIEEDATRINLYFKKVKHTPNKYPRAYGQIKKKPLED